MGSENSLTNSTLVTYPYYPCSNLISLLREDMPDFRSVLGIAKSGISRYTSPNLDKTFKNDYISTRQNRVLIKVTKLIKNQQFRGKKHG